MTKQETGKGIEPMHFTSIGFTQDTGCRVFAYEGIGADRVRVRYTVRADLALSRKFGIRLQELPLMCLGILEHSVEANETPALRALTFTEEAMCRYAEDCVSARDAAALKRNSQRRQPAKAAIAPPSEANPPGGFSPATGTPAWRTW
jgi:hypothetical protein